MTTRAAFPDASIGFWRARAIALFLPLLDEDPAVRLARACGDLPINLPDIVAELIPPNFFEGQSLTTNREACANYCATTVPQHAVAPLPAGVWRGALRESSSILSFERA